MRVLVTGWPSFLHGEATAGDVLSMRRVSAALAGAGIASDSAWSPVFRPGGLNLGDADPGKYSHVVFACGPAHGWQVRELHHRYARCRRIAIGVSVIDPHDPAVTGFHRLFARDDGFTANADLATSSTTDAVPVIGVVFAPGQREYGSRGRHDVVHDAVTRWLTGLDCARVPLDSRLDPTDWRHCGTPDQFTSLLARLDAVVTTRLHGLTLALRAGIPALAIDPVAGGGKVSAQARALDWPAVVGADHAVEPAAFDDWWSWCLSAAGRTHAKNREGSPDVLVADLVRELLAEAPP
jgi:hypothetical protein